jgi:D-alanyl-D-alanine carboxypeptidase
MHRWLAILLLAGRLSAQDVATEADAFVKNFVGLHKFQGTVLLARDGQPLFRKSYGLANAEWDIANTPDTKFRLGSITKQFTAALILQLVEQGKLSLTDSIRKYYPEAPEAWDAVTIHDLLTHESGIPSYTDIPGFFDKQAAIAFTPLELIRLTQDKPLAFRPGSQFRYDNTGYILLGYVIEKLTGHTYEEQLRTAILDPLGMKDTGYDHYTAILPHRAEGYEFDKGKLKRAAFLDMSVPYAAGSLYSTVDDLLKWDRALDGDKVLTAASKDKMWTPNLNDYGYGWVIPTRFGERVMEHGGGINGFNTMIIRAPAKKLLVVALSNVETPATGEIATGLLALALGRSPTGKNRKAVVLTPDALKRFEGVYAMNGSFKLTVAVDGGRLYAQANGQGRTPLDAMSPTRFFNNEINLELEFVPDASALTVYQNGSEVRFKRESQAQAAGARSFEVASVEPAEPGPIRCSGGPGTSDPVLWRCSSVPLGLLITEAYDFQAYQFRPNDPCCTARFDITAKVAAGTTKEQFHRMMQTFLEERFQLKLHLAPKQMPVYELTVGEKGLKMKESGPASPAAQEDPWEIAAYTVGKDGYPMFPSGKSGLAGPNGHYRWVGFRLSMPEIVKTLSFHLGRPVVDATGLTGTYDIDMKWGVDIAWLLERAGHGDEVAGLPDSGPSGPPLLRAVPDQLGLKLNAKQGRGEIVVIDHLEKAPTRN